MRAWRRLQDSFLNADSCIDSDAEFMYNNWASDPEVSKYLTWPTHTSVEVTKTLLTDWIVRYEKPDYYNVMQKAGMKYEGTLRGGGRDNQGIMDEVWYGLLKTDRA